MTSFTFSEAIIVRRVLHGASRLSRALFVSVPPLKPSLLRLPRLHQGLPTDGSTSPCVTATTSGSRPRSPLYLLKAFVKEIFGGLGRFSRLCLLALAVMRPARAPHLLLVAPK